MTWRIAALVALAACAAGPPAVAQTRPAESPYKRSGGTAQAPAPAPAPPPAPAPTAASIPVPWVVVQGEEVNKLLRDVEALVVPGPAVQTIEQRLPAIADRVGQQIEATARQLDDHVAATTLEALTAQWQATRMELTTYVAVLAERAARLESAMAELVTVRDTWTRTREHARTSRAPAPVIGRIDGVLASAAGAETRLQERRAATLVLQDRVAHEVGRCDVTLARIAGMRTATAARLLVADAEPLWRPGQLALVARDLPAQVRAAVAAEAPLIPQFAQDQRAGITVQVALLGALLLVMARARAGAPGVDQRLFEVFDRPLSAALVLTLLASKLIYGPPMPGSLAAAGLVTLLVATVRVMRLGLVPRLAAGLYLLGAFLLAELLRHVASVIPLLERQIFLLEMAIAIGVLGWLLRSGRLRAAAADTRPGRERAWSATAAVAVGLFAIALAAAVAGYMKLAHLLGAGVLGSAFVALVLRASLRVGDGLVARALGTWPLSSLGMVRRHPRLLAGRAHGLLRWLTIGGWAILTLQYFGLWRRVVEQGQALLGAEVRRGSLSVSVGDALVFVLTVVSAFVLSALIRFVLDEEVYPHLRLARGLPTAFSALLHYALLLSGFLLAMAALNIDFTKATILAGAFGVGLGFGLQGLVNNFVSGLVVLFERRIDVGDAVQIGEVAGQVQQIGMRACTVRTWDGAEVIVPNASLVADKVTNWTLSDRQRRIDIPVRVAYGSSPEKVLELLLAVARAHRLVVAAPEPVALVLGFGDSALRFELRAWTNRFDLWPQIQSDLGVALYAALNEAGLEIPFPQHEVRLHQA